MTKGTQNHVLVLYILKPIKQPMMRKRVMNTTLAARLGIYFHR